MSSAPILAMKLATILRSLRPQPHFLMINHHFIYGDHRLRHWRPLVKSLSSHQRKRNKSKPLFLTSRERVHVFHQEPQLSFTRVQIEELAEATYICQPKEKEKTEERRKRTPKVFLGGATGEMAMRCMHIILVKSFKILVKYIQYYLIRILYFIISKNKTTFRCASISRIGSSD